MRGSSAGTGLAIPADILHFEVTTLIRDGQITRPAIGISYLESARSSQLGIDKGMLVLAVPQGTNVANAGLQGLQRQADGNVSVDGITTGLNGDPIDNENDLFRCRCRAAASFLSASTFPSCCPYLHRPSAPHSPRRSSHFRCQHSQHRACSFRTSSSTCSLPQHISYHLHPP